MKIIILAAAVIMASVPALAERNENRLGGAFASGTRNTLERQVAMADARLADVIAARDWAVDHGASQDEIDRYDAAVDTMTAIDQDLHARCGC